MRWLDQDINALSSTGSRAEPGVAEVLRSMTSSYREPLPFTQIQTSLFSMCPILWASLWIIGLGIFFSVYLKMGREYCKWIAFLSPQCPQSETIDLKRNSEAQPKVGLGFQHSATPSVLLCEILGERLTRNTTLHSKQQGREHKRAARLKHEEALRPASVTGD